MKQLLAVFWIGMMALAACGNDARTDEGAGGDVAADHRKVELRRKQAEAEAEMSRQAMRQAQAEQQELAQQLKDLNATVEALAVEAAAIEAELASARTQEDRDRVVARKAELERRQREVQARLTKIRAGVKLKCPPDQPLC